MQPFTSVAYPVRIHAGDNALDALGRECDRAGATRAFIVCGRSLAAEGKLIARIQARLGPRFAGMYAGIGKDAPVADVQAAVAQARACDADILLAVGAGSVIKATRVIAILLAEPEPIEQLVTRYAEGAAPVSPRLLQAKLPIVNILTAATSAQNRAGAALKNQDAGFRMEFFDPKTRPRAIFWDAGALLTAPPALSRSTACSVYWRALMNIGACDSANPLVQGDRRQAFHLADRAFERASDPQDADARIELCAAALLQNRDEDDGGRPFDAHWIARVVYALAAAAFNLFPRIDQGQANASLTGAAIRHFGDRCPEATLAIGRELGLQPIPDTALAMAQACEQVGRAVDERFRRSRMFHRLRDLGVGKADLAEIARLSLRNFNADREGRFAEDRTRLEAVLQAAW
jgi:alcohol dehydrogenase class IV